MRDWTKLSDSKAGAEGFPSPEGSAHVTRVTVRMVHHYLAKKSMRPNNQSQGQKRGRNRNNNNRRGGGGSHRQTFDSNGPSVRIRGTAAQINEKYLTMARDASSSGDRVLAESYLQHAEHYFRILNQDAEARQARMAKMQAEAEADSDEDDNEQESAVEVTVTGSASNENDDDESSSESNNRGNGAAQKAEQAEAGTDEEEQPAKRAPQRRRRTPRAKVPNSPAELAAAAESAAD